nr:MAG TPA: hypothetical protein [Caudoviricetes sp.]DAR70031.1 MAG TPA: hypothetical protein [Caudoviricetes sp.]DAW70926.1 MAG TPA: hypothetical protein [Caudoviricetes sp.]
MVFCCIDIIEYSLSVSVSSSFFSPIINQLASIPLKLVNIFIMVS